MARIYRRKALRSSFGITLEDYERLLALQDGRCAICGRVPGKRRLHVDHDHSSQVIRGLLCGQCNMGLGLFETPAVLETAAWYLSDREPLLIGTTSSQEKAA